MSNEKEQKRPAHLLARDFKDAEYVRNIHAAMPPAGTPMSALKIPEFWSSVAPSLRPNSRIEVMPADGAYFVELIVRSVGPNWARVEVLREKEFISAASLVAKIKDFKVEWGGPSHKHRVVRLSDKEVVKCGFDTPEQAGEWLVANQQAMTAA